jgi:hypothetical protein
MLNIIFSSVICPAIVVGVVLGMVLIIPIAYNAKKKERWAKKAKK